jgi:hypothetical protein
VQSSLSGLPGSFKKKQKITIKKNDSCDSPEDFIDELFLEKDRLSRKAITEQLMQASIE